MTEVPLVVVKQSANDLTFADLMMMAPDKLIYSAVDADVSVLHARRPGSIL
jgi:4-hydroxy-tetrahydrodipicolinate synthase